ncbi:MAG: galactokinase [Clostridiales bacterium]|nr:galactokinase [Clostridiales bacterium]
MDNLYTVREKISMGAFDDRLERVYESKAEVLSQRDRYIALVDDFEEIFGARDGIRFFSAPGRTEIGGNHTDHNHGCVLAASINLDAIAAAVPSAGTNKIRVKSAGYNMDVVDLNELTPQKSEEGTSAALIRGICARFKQLGYNIGGFDAATVSRVLSGSGLSSSAAFEVLISTILNHMFNDGKISAVEIAKISQYAENKFFNKPCGLMDQTACSVGGFVKIDFQDTENPVIESVNFDFSHSGHVLCIIDTGGSHSDLTDEYAAIRKDMCSVAQALGGETLRDISKEKFDDNFVKLRLLLGDRALLRSMHFFKENERVALEAQALEKNDFSAFKKLVIESGRSSYMYNQNVYAKGATAEQPVAVALAMSETMLAGKGAWRVHGGGFAGTIQVFLPKDMLGKYIKAMQGVFGKKSCYVLSVRRTGGAEI